MNLFIKFVPEYYIDALEDGEATITGKYTTKNNNIKDASIKVRVKHTHVKGKRVEENYIDSTCTSRGSYDEIIYCALCNKELQNKKIEIEMKPHVSGPATIENVVEPTCLTGGSYDEVVYCKNCNYKLKSTNKTISRLGHNYVNEYCTRCGHKKEAEAGVYDSAGNLMYTWETLLNKGFQPSADNTGSLSGAIGLEAARKVNKVIISDTLTTIGQDSFRNLNITEVAIPDSVINIKGWVFKGCTSLKSVTIPSSVTYIGKECFMNCTSITSVKFDNSPCSLDEKSFSTCKNLVNIDFGDNLISIGYKAFDCCYALKNVVLPNSVTSISERAFADCSNFESLTMSDNIQFIGYRAFDGCSKLKTIKYKGVTYKSVDSFCSAAKANGVSVSSQ